MRLAYVCLDPGVPVFGRKGSSIHCQEIMRAFQRRGHEIELFAKRLGDDVPADLQGVRAHKLGGKLSREAETREHELFALNPVVEQALESSAPFDLIYERYSLWSFSAMQFAHDHHVASVLEINSPLVDEQKTFRTLIDEPKAKQARNDCFQYADSLIAVSDQVAERIRKIDVARDKTSVASNGVNCDAFSSSVNARASQSEDDSRQVVIGFVGTLKPWHGVDVLLNAFALLLKSNPNVCLKIVGAGPEAENLKEQLSQLPADVQQSVQWLGAIPNAEMPDVLATFDVAVAPYPDLKDFYFSPLKIFEYMAAGCAVVASDIGQIPSLISQDQTGVLVKPGCQEELAAALKKLCSDGQSRQRLGLAARTRVEQNHSWNSVVDRIQAIVAESKPQCEVI